MRPSLVILLALACTACVPEHDPPRSAPAADTDAPTSGIAAAPATGAAGTAYRCDDGSRVHVALADHRAAVTLPDGRRVELPRAESASKGGGDVYVGEALGVMLEGDALQLERDEAGTLHCVAR